MTAPEEERPQWTVRASGSSSFTAVMSLMMLGVLAIFGFGLPKLTGRSELLVIPIAALAGIAIIIVRMRGGHRIAVEPDAIVYTRGRRRREFRLDACRWGYARIRQPYVGVTGTALIVQDDDDKDSLAIGGYKFMFDDPSYYRAGEIEDCDLWFFRETPFRDFITRFEQARARVPPMAAQPTSASGANARRGEDAAHSVTLFELERNRLGKNAFKLVLVINLAVYAVGGGAGWMATQLGTHAGIATGAGLAALIAIAFIVRWRCRRPPSIAVQAGELGLYRSSRLEQRVLPSQLAWSAGRYRVRTRHTSWDMAVMVLTFPGRDPLSIGTLDQSTRWAFETPAVACPDYLLGVADWRHLARCLGIAAHLQ